jgi:hypothetical protein
MSKKIQNIYCINLFPVKIPLPLREVHFKLEKTKKDEYTSDIDIIQLIETRCYINKTEKSIFSLNSLYNMVSKLDKDLVCKIDNSDNFMKIVSITNVMIMLKINHLKECGNISVLRKGVANISSDIEKFWRNYYRACKIGYKSIFCISYSYI